MRILFVHSDCSGEYAFSDLERMAMGGTESTILRITEELAKRGHQIILAQGARKNSDQSAAGVQYAPFRLNKPFALSFDVVVVIDVDKILGKLKRQYSRSRFYVWMHCVPGRRKANRILREQSLHGLKVLAVSEYHRDLLEKKLRTDPEDTSVCYNPVSDELRENDTLVDEFKLLFLSSPHKGLKQVLDTFRHLRKVEPRYRLFIADPGYISGFTPDDMPDGVVTLGSMPHPEVIEHLRSSFCLFYPQSQFEETFGIVFAEAHAVGTPVLAHPLGAAPEVVGSEEELANADRTEDIIKRIMSWQITGRPKPRLNPAFRLTSVIKNWEATLMASQAELSKV
jgi:glycosyltransferase involved in cell wall biosynthesis